MKLGVQSYANPLMDASGGTSPAARPPSMHLSILRRGQGWDRWGVRLLRKFF